MPVHAVIVSTDAALVATLSMQHTHALVPNLGKEGLSRLKATGILHYETNFGQSGVCWIQQHPHHKLATRQ